MCTFAADFVPWRMREACLGLKHDQSPAAGRRHPHAGLASSRGSEGVGLHCGTASYNALFLVSLNLRNSNLLSKTLQSKRLWRGINYPVCVQGGTSCLMHTLRV